MNIPWFENHRFESPHSLLALFILPVLVWLYNKHQKRLPSVRVGFVAIAPRENKWLRYVRHLPFLFRVTGITALIIAISNPQEIFIKHKIRGKGIDIVLCFDISGSMTAQDVLPNRLEAAKQIAGDFVKSRPGDRIGIVIFSNQSFTLCPLTTDHHTVVSQISSIQSGFLPEDGTAIGSGMATSIDRLKDSKSLSKVVILLTDGLDFGGAVPPDIAEKMANIYKVKVYTIGVGINTNIKSKELIPSSDADELGMNENLLKHISKSTGGLYFSANDRNGLQKSYESISKLEKSDIEDTVYNLYENLYLLPAVIAIISLIAEFIITKIWFPLS